jgi:hypothetical protein
LVNIRVPFVTERFLEEKQVLACLISAKAFSVLGVAFFHLFIIPVLDCFPLLIDRYRINFVGVVTIQPLLSFLSVSWVIVDITKLLIPLIPLLGETSQIRLVLSEKIPAVFPGIAHSIFAIAVIKILSSVLAHILAVRLSELLATVFETLVLPLMECP